MCVRMMCCATCSLWDRQSTQTSQLGHQVFLRRQPRLVTAFFSRTGSLLNAGVDLPSQNLAQNRQYRDTVTCLPAHTEQRFAKVAEVRVICTRSGSIVILLPPSHQQGSRNNQGHRMNQRCTIMTKLVLCSAPHACAQTAVRQMMIVR